MTRLDRGFKGYIAAGPRLKIKNVVAASLVHLDHNQMPSSVV